jgi:hypothetical protein
VRVRWRIFLAVVLASFFATRFAASALTAAGTAVSNVANFSYTTTTGAFTGTSNTLTTYVQNAPAVTVTVLSANQSVTPAMYAADTFILLNAGNATGALALPIDATFGGTAGIATLKGYVINALASGTCSYATPCASGTLNGLAAMTSVAPTSSVQVSVVYSVSASAAPNNTIQTTLTATVAYGAVSNAAAETSASTTAASPPTDTLIIDARLDLAASGTISGSNITWQVKANNGGGSSGQGLASAQTLLGASNPGIVIFIPVPVFSAVPLQIQSPPGVPTPVNAGTSTAAVYYSATACSAHPTVWNATYGSALCIAVYVSNASQANVLPQTTGSGGANDVTAAQITFTFTTNQPNGTNAGGANAVTLVASSAIGGLSWVSPASVGGGLVPILGQGLLLGAQQDGATASYLNNIVANTTISSGLITPGGSSNQAGSNATVAYSVLNGPMNNPGATGSYPAPPNNATPTPSLNLDYTAVNATCNGAASVYGGGANCTIATGGIIIPNTVNNTGNTADTITLTAYAPAGWTVQIFNPLLCTPSTPGAVVPSCTLGTSITGAASTSGGSISGTVLLASNASLTYVAQYIAGAPVTPFVGVDGKITAAGVTGGGTGADTNDTHDDIYPGGVIQVSDSVATSSNCPAAAPALPGTATCPGAVLTYSIAYQNMAPALAMTNKGSEPSFAYAALNLTGGTLLLTTDGAAAGNSWASYSFGLNALPTDTTSNTIFTPANGTAYASGTYPGMTAGYTKFTAQVGGAAGVVNAGASGTITYSVTVK